jgi:hypothetical protein
MTAQQHSLSLPLRIVLREKRTHQERVVIVDVVEANGRLVCTCDPYDAQEIIRSVNSFRDLLKACRTAIDDPRATQTTSSLREAIRKAEL